MRLLSFCFLPALALGRSFPDGQSTGPVAVPTKVVGNQWLVRATVDGREGWFLLAAGSKTSILLPRSGQSGPDGRRQRASVSIGNENGDEVSFRVANSPNLKPLGVDGVLGADALAGFNLAVDIEEAQVLTWAEQPSLYSERGWILLAPMVASSTQHATTLSIHDVDTTPSGIAGGVGLAHGLIVLQTSELTGQISGQALAAADNLTVTEGSAGSVAVDGVMLGDLGPFWVVAGDSSAPLPYAAAKQIGSLPITSVPVRRLVLDGHTGTVVTEQLGPTGVDAIQLSRLLGIPLDIQQGTLYIRHEGALYGTDLLAYDGAAIVDIAAIPASDIVAALQATAAAKLAMLKRLALARVAGYKLNLQKAGNTYATTVKPGAH